MEWRAIFWINIPVAIIALVLIYLSKPEDTRTPTKLDYRGTVLITGSMGLLVLGLQQSSQWGWGSAATWACVIAGLVLMIVFVRVELRTPEPLLRLQIFGDRAFAVENLVLGLMSIVFVPFFFFASLYAQIALGKTSSQAGEYLLYFFLGFVIASQIGGRILDRRGAKLAVVSGSALGAAGFFLLAGKLTDLSLGSQTLYIILAGAGLGMMLGVASTDAVNRAPSSSYSEVTGITQTSRNFGASLGLAVRRDPDQPQQHQRHERADEGRRSEQRRSPRGGIDRHRDRRRQLSRGSTPGARARRPARLRALDADDLLSDGRRDGGDVHRRRPRAAARPHRARCDFGRLGPGARSRILSLTAPVARAGRFGETDPVRPIGDRLT